MFYMVYQRNTFIAPYNQLSSVRQLGQEVARVGLLEGKSAHSLKLTFLSNSEPVVVTMSFSSPLHWNFTFHSEGYKGERMWN
jgi:hypothetical protein